MSDTVERLKAALADRYAIQEELGAGGMATVYLAQGLKHHRQVALKVLRPEIAAAVGPERFLREIECGGELKLITWIEDPDVISTVTVSSPGGGLNSPSLPDQPCDPFPHILHDQLEVAIRVFPQLDESGRWLSSSKR